MVATGCGGSGSKGGGAGSGADTRDPGTTSYSVTITKPVGGFISSGSFTNLDGSTASLNCGTGSGVDMTACSAGSIKRVPSASAPTVVQPVTLTATPLAGFVFKGWGGACVDGQPKCVLTPPTDTSLTVAYSVSAVFQQVIDPNVDPGPTGRVYGYVFDAGVTVTSAVKAASLSPVTLTFTSNPKLVVGQTINVTYASADITAPAVFKNGLFTITAASTASPWTATYDDKNKAGSSGATAGTPPVVQAPISGITVSLQQNGATVASASTMAKGLGSISGGRYAIDAAPGTYQVVVSDAAGKFTFAAQTDATVGSDPASCTVEPQMVTEGGEGVAGCLVRKDITNAAAAPVGYVAPAITITTNVNGAAAPAYQVGLGVPVTLDCTATGGTFGSAISTKWTGQTAGPTAEDTTAWSGSQVFNVPTMDTLVALTLQADTTQTVTYPYAGQPWASASKVVSCPKYDGEFQGTQGAGNQLTKVGCSAANLYFPDNALSFLSVGRQMMNELAYTFVCTATRTASGADVLAMSKATNGLVTVQFAAAHGITTGEMVTVKFTTADANYKAGTFKATVTAADTFTYNDGLTIASAAGGPAFGTYSFSISATKSAQFFPLNIVNAALPNDAKIVGVAAPAQLDTFASVPQNSIILANGGKATSAGGYGWTLTPPSGVSATLNGTGRFVWFKASAVDSNGYSLALSTNFGDATKTPAAKAIGVIGSTWIGFTGVGSFGSCQSCHTGTGSGPKQAATDWSASAHTQIVNGGMSGPDYSNSCLACHTQGYDVSGLNNGGWFDVAKTAGPSSGQYNMPDFMFLSDANKNFGVKALPASLQKLSNIACENCHGPGGGAHPDRATFSADACKVCHDGGHHNIFNQWQSEGHSSKSTSDGRVGRASCQPCHVAQGIVTYWDSYLKTGTKVSGDGITFANLTTDNNSPVTCQVCHEPHGLKLRIGEAQAAAGMMLGSNTAYADYSLPSCNASASPPVVLPNCNQYTNAPSWSGIKLDSSVGEGALCMACHNSRRSYGRIVTDATTTPPTAIENAMPSWVTPHDSTATEIYLNQGTYWFGTTPPNYNVHKAEAGWVKNGCVDCHVKVIPAGYPTVANHTFDANHSCEVCHGSGMLPDGSNSKGQELAQRTEEQIQAIADAMLVKINAYNAAVPLKIGGVDVTGLTLAKLEIVDGSLLVYITEAQAPIKTNVDGITRIGSVVGPPAFAAGSKLVVYNSTGDGANIDFAKAEYNVMIVQRDFSEGVHNPQGVKALLDATLAAVNALMLQ